MKNISGEKVIKMKKSISGEGSRIELDKKVEEKVDSAYTGICSHGSHRSHSSS